MDNESNSCGPDGDYGPWARVRGGRLFYKFAVPPEVDTAGFIWVDRTAHAPRTPIDYDDAAGRPVWVGTRGRPAGKGAVGFVGAVYRTRDEFNRGLTPPFYETGICDTLEDALRELAAVGYAPADPHAVPARLRWSGEKCPRTAAAV